jgi:hypothetical protein
MWTPKGKRPIVLTSGSHQKTCVFGALCIDGRQFFRQYSTFNQDTFVQYLKELQMKFRKLILFLDRAAQHYRSSKVRKHLEESKGVIRVEYLPKRQPECSPLHIPKRHSTFFIQTVLSLPTLPSSPLEHAGSESIV